MKETARKDLENYLRDHYAGGVSALELLEHLVKEHAHGSLGGFFRQLQADIAADHEQLLNLMEALQFEQSRMRNAGAWVAEKFAQAKVGFTSGEDSPLRLFQLLEVLLLGVTGKELLWRALEAAKEASPVLARTDFQQLIVRAHEQAERIETERLKAARTTLVERSGS